MTFNEFLIKYYEYNIQHFNLRKGQNLMNFLNSISPEIYNMITATKHDCFYDDSRINETIDYLMNKWN
jgi:hypothetical protein